MLRRPTQDAGVTDASHVVPGVLRLALAIATPIGAAFGQDPAPPPNEPPPRGATSLFAEGLGAWLESAGWASARGAVIAPAGGSPLVSRESYANYELHVGFRLSPGAIAEVVLEGRHVVTLRDAAVAGAEPGWQGLAVHFRHDRHQAPVVRALLNGAPMPDGSVVDRGALSEPFDAQQPDSLPGLRHVWLAGETPDFGDGRFSVFVRFRARGDGTLVAKAPPRGKWAPNGKTLFLRGGRLVYDIGWVGALQSKRRFDDDEWHTVAVGHEGRTAFLVVDGEVVAKRDDFTSKDADGHVLKVGATSPDFAGGFRQGEIAEVTVYGEPLTPDLAQRLTRGGDIEIEPLVRWDSTVPSNVPPADPGGAAVSGPIALRSREGGVQFANVWIRPLSEVDHAGIIGSWDASAITRGEKLYRGMCATCHGAEHDWPDFVTVPWFCSIVPSGIHRGDSWPGVGSPMRSTQRCPPE